ncbi:MAG: hypothetical protein Q9227_001702 [Pyrenula ochraceoflavens]
MVLTEKQKYSFARWVENKENLGTTINGVVETLGASALLARQSLSGGVQSPIGPNQWQREIQHWQNTAIAKLQKIVVEFATGPSDASVQQYVEEPSNKAAQNICENQKVRSASHTSFSVLGLCITLIIGGTIVLLEMTIEHLTRLFQRRSGTTDYHRLEWTANETLQIQRMAHEGIGAGTWTRAVKNVPTTLHRENLAILDVSDTQHPRLINPDENISDPAKGWNMLSRQTTFIESPTGPREKMNSPEKIGINDSTHSVSRANTPSSPEKPPNFSLPRPQRLDPLLGSEMERFCGSEKSAPALDPQQLVRSPQGSDLPPHAPTAISGSQIESAPNPCTTFRLSATHSLDLENRLDRQYRGFDED